MARKTKCQVKCQATGESGTTEIFYKAPDGKYYKSIDVYNVWLAGREYQKKADSKKAAKKHTEAYREMVDLLCDYLGYEDNQPFPTYLTKKLKELNYYPDDVLLETTKLCKDKILYALKTKDFASEVNKINYITAIIRNVAPDVSKEMEHERDALQNQQAEECDSRDTYVRDFGSAPYNSTSGNSETPENNNVISNAIGASI